MKMMDFNSVKGKVAIVTGAGRGIGRAIAECFGENGMKVVCAARSAEQGQAVADGICAKGGDAIFIQTDCSKASAIKELVDKNVKNDSTGEYEPNGETREQNVISKVFHDPSKVTVVDPVSSSARCATSSSVSAMWVW